MANSMYLMFNHRLTDEQILGAREDLGTEKIEDMPEELRKTWGRVPPEMPEIYDYLAPFRQWLEENATAGDAVLLQGDFGACYLMVRHAFDMGLVPVYATTRREAREVVGEDGTVTVTHFFKHVKFRKYGE